MQATLTDDRKIAESTNSTLAPVDSTQPISVAGEQPTTLIDRLLAGFRYYAAYHSPAIAGSFVSAKATSAADENSH